jgi:hypothetical protein
MSRPSVETTKNSSYSKCINHRDRAGKFKVDLDHLPYLYCEDCAFELSHKGKRLVPLRSDEGGSKMVTEAREYVRVCDEMLKKLVNQMGGFKH